MTLETQIERNLEIARSYLEPIRTNKINPGVEFNNKSLNVSVKINSRINEPNLRKWKEVYKRMNVKIPNITIVDGWEVVPIGRRFIPFEFYCLYELYRIHLKRMNIEVSSKYIHPKFGYVGGFKNVMVMIPMFSDEVMIYSDHSDYELYKPIMRNKPRYIDGLNDLKVEKVGDIVLEIAGERKSYIDLLGIPINKIESDSYGNKYYKVQDSLVVYREGKMLMVFDDRLRQFPEPNYVLHHNTLYTGITIRKYLGILYIELKGYNPEVL